MKMYPRSVIEVRLQIACDDGSKFSCCLNAASLALLDAGVAMLDLAVAASAAVVENQLFWDPTRPEQRDAASVDVAILPNHDRRLVFADLDAAHRSLDLKELQRFLSCGIDAATHTAHHIADIARELLTRAIYIREVSAALPPLNTLTPPGGIPNGHTTTTKKIHHHQQQLLRSRDDEEEDKKQHLAAIGEKSESRPVPAGRRQQQQ